MIIIEINERESAVEARNVQTKSGPQTFYHQTAYIHRPGAAYPDRFRVPVKSQAHGYAPGQYLLGPSCFKVGKFGDLEINRFDFALEPAQRPAEVKRAS